VSATAPDGRTLVGTVVRLDPLVPDDAPALFAALDDPQVWAAGYAGGPDARPGDLARDLADYEQYVVNRALVAGGAA